MHNYMFLGAPSGAPIRKQYSPQFLEQNLLLSQTIVHGLRGTALQLSLEWNGTEWNGTGSDLTGRIQHWIISLLVNSELGCIGKGSYLSECICLSRLRYSVCF